ncbi:Gfo/Idh/MocA family oxidoreductase [Spirillospora sp. CA-255316]
MAKRVVLVGLGVTGLAMARSLLRRTDFEVVGAADRNPRTLGEDLGVLLHTGSAGVTVTEHIEHLPPADLAIVATTSDLNQVADTLLPLLKRSYNVLSICEELAYPWTSHPEAAERLDTAAKANGVTVLGSGANPGILMDTLPLLLSALTQRVERVVIRRRTNMSRYGAILAKFGLGLSPERFAEAQAASRVAGHHGFEQAISAVASGLGWDLDAIEVDQVVPSIVSDGVRVGEHATIEPGCISAVTHAARGVLAGVAVIDLEIMFGFFDPGDPVAPGDEYRIEGAEQVVDLSSAVGFESFLSTIATAVNTAAAVVDAAPGLLSMGDLPARAIASKGARLAEEALR